MDGESKKKRFGGRKSIAIVIICSIVCSIIIILGIFIISNPGHHELPNAHQGVIQVNVQGGPHADHGSFTLFVHEVCVVMNQTIQTSQSLQYNYTVIWFDSQISSNGSFVVMLAWDDMPEYYRTAIVPDGGIATVDFTIWIP